MPVDEGFVEFQDVGLEITEKIQERITGSEVVDGHRDLGFMHIADKAAETVAFLFADGFGHFHFDIPLRNVIGRENALDFF